MEEWPKNDINFFKENKKNSLKVINMINGYKICNVIGSVSSSNIKMQ